jgi:drug/metabolite transporter (DMT)-like permease
MDMNGKLKILTSMAIFGTIGIFVRFIPLPSAVIAFCRGVLGCLFLLAFMMLTKKKLSLPDIKQNLWRLVISGAAIGINWILLFEAYRYTTVAIATICYYLAPAFMTLASPLVGEKLTAKKLGCIVVAMIGMVFVSGVFQGSEGGSLAGVLLGIGAALFYASVILINKTLSPIGAYDRTLCQLGTASLVIVPYLLIAGGISFTGMTTMGWIMLIIVGIVHTGIAYTLYFGAIRDVNAQTAAILSYLDPVLSILLSALILRESLDVFSIIGAVLILGSALYSELPGRKK